jgi:hypothetical protein
MNNTIKRSILFLVALCLCVVFNSVSAAAVLKEQNLKIKTSAAEDKIFQARITIKESNGGPAVNSLRINYPPSTRLMVTASLALQKGSYKVEIMDKGKTMITVTAENGKTVKDSGEFTVDETGSMQYRVTAKKANNVVFDLSFIPVAVRKDSPPSQVVSYDKTSGGNDGLNLVLAFLAGKNCTLRVQNTSKSKAYRNILFQIDYSMMGKEEVTEKIKRGTIDDTLLPDKTGEWPIGLVFGEPPRNIKIKLVSADTVDPGAVTGSDRNQPPKVVNLTAVSERSLKK